MDDLKMICSCGCGERVKMAEECFDCHDRPDRTGMCVNCTWRVEAEHLYHIETEIAQQAIGVLRKGK